MGAGDLDPQLRRTRKKEEEEEEDHPPPLSSITMEEEKEDSPPQSSSLIAPVLRCAQVDSLEPLDDYDTVCLPVFEVLIVKPPRPPAATSSGTKIKRQTSIYVVAKKKVSFCIS